MAYINVVIPVYNAEQYLLDTVRSVLEQPEKDIEIILVDDGSIDASGKICDEIAQTEERVSVVHKANGGVSSARNVGIEHFLKTCKSGYIAFCDADDLWVPNALSHTVIKEIKNEDADIVGFSMYCSNSDATRFCVANKYEDNIEIKQKYEDKHLFGGGSFAAHLYSIRLFMQNPVRFVEGCTHNEDVIFSAKMFFCAQKLLYKDNFLYIYRKNFQSSTNTVEYTLDNAFEIPEAWFEAKGFVNKCKDINDKCKRNWKKFCETTSSIRCLEMISILAEQGIEYESMYNIMRHKEYFVNIDNLKSSELAEWQITDLLTYKRDKVYFYNSKKQNSINKRLKSLSRWKCIRYLIEKRKYKLVIKDIL